MYKSLFVVLCLLIISCEPNSEADYIDLYVGTYTEKLGHVDGNAKGISSFIFNEKTGKLIDKGIKVETQNPSFIAIHPSNKFIYAVSEKGGIGELNLGSVIAFRRNEETGELIKINEVASGGKYPCYISVSADGNYLFTANYGGGLAMHIIHEDGRLGTKYFSLKHKGKGVHPRQETSHIHMAQVVGEFVWVTDLGTDAITIYRIDRIANELKLHQEIKLPSGSGPRHLTVSQNRKNVYIVNELNSSINLLKKNDRQQWIVDKTYELREEEFRGYADVHLSPNNRFLYVSSRAEFNSICVYAVNEKSGELAFVEETKTGGQTPRNFVISPNGRFLLTANQDSRNVSVLEVDQQTGKLTLQNTKKTKTPVCLKFLLK